MSECCSSCQPPTSPNKHRCPVNGKEYGQVQARTIMHHLRQPWHWQDNRKNYYFCDDPGCEVVYFAEDDSTITQTSLRTPVGIKEQQKSSTLCYCFGVSFQDAEQDDQVKPFVTEQTRQQVCDCEIRNPSGRCCLKDFPKT